MTLGLLLIPIISAGIGWYINGLAIKMLFHPKVPKKILGIRFQGILPKNQPLIAAKLGTLASAELLSFEDIIAKVTNAENIEKLMPVVGTHIDHFLRVKLAEKMPVISMFIGEKTISELKGVFMEELKTLFPALMGSYVNNLQKDLDLAQIITQKVASISSDKLEEIFYNVMNKQLRYIKLIGAVIGFIIGILQIGITLLKF
ncbi:DUF445 domain-containing protein [Parasediminibacterium paludis]|uniref:DUF445 domain-containing protein n=1 Tax=Parasediminibacterium paludis TaxID=908966 RepID=A0ABV8PSS6_9BACT